MSKTLTQDQKIKLIKGVDEIFELFKAYYVSVVRNSKCGPALMAFMKYIKGESKDSIASSLKKEINELEALFEQAKETLKNPTVSESNKIMLDMKEIVDYSIKSDSISTFVSLLMKKENKELVEFLVELLIPENIDINLKEESFNPTKQANNSQEWDLLMSKVRYPSTKNLTTNIANLKTYSDNMNRINRDEVKKYLLSINRNAIIIENPYLIYSYRLNNQYRPDLLIKTDDNKNILVLCLPVANMAITCNQRRYRELDTYCKENGYGYLIMDSDGVTLEDVKNTPINEAVEDKLNEMLYKKGNLYWEEIKEFKDYYRVSSRMIFAYILKNRLHFNLRPYCISDPVREKELDRSR